MLVCWNQETILALVVLRARVYARVGVREHVYLYVSVRVRVDYAHTA